MPRDFCNPDKYSILIPYRDFVKLVESARKIEEMSRQYRHMEEMYDAMKSMYQEALDRIEELSKYV